MSEEGSNGLTLLNVIVGALEIPGIESNLHM